MQNHYLITKNRNLEGQLDIPRRPEFMPLSLPIVRRVLQALEGEPLIFTFVNEKVGQCDQLLVFCLVYRSQLLPLAWMKRQNDREGGEKTPHIKLLKQLLQWIPKSAEVVLLGDSDSYVDILAWTRTNTTWQFLLSNLQDKFVKHRWVW